MISLKSSKDWLLVAGLAFLGFIGGIFTFGSGLDLPRCEELGDRCGAVLDPIMYTGIAIMAVALVVLIGSLVMAVAVHMKKDKGSRST